MSVVAQLTTVNSTMYPAHKLQKHEETNENVKKNIKLNQWRHTLLSLPECISIFLPILSFFVLIYSAMTNQLQQVLIIICVAFAMAMLLYVMRAVDVRALVWPIRKPLNKRTRTFLFCVFFFDRPFRCSCRFPFINRYYLYDFVCFVTFHAPSWRWTRDAEMMDRKKTWFSFFSTHGQFPIGFFYCFYNVFRWRDGMDAIVCAVSVFRIPLDFFVVFFFGYIYLAGLFRSCSVNRHILIRVYVPHRFKASPIFCGACPNETNYNQIF